ncbi:MAG: GMC family oxidoreductase N-terminal domain-containing protein [Nitriliruptoraceae bacterium]
MAAPTTSVPRQRVGGTSSVATGSSSGSWGSVRSIAGALPVDAGRPFTRLPASRPVSPASQRRRREATTHRVNGLAASAPSARQTIASLDGRRHAVRSTPERDHVAFDHIVVGSGSSGAAVAAGLATEPDTSVLLLEAGPRDRDPRIRIPAAVTDLWFGPLDWSYVTTPQSGLDGRVDAWPRGRVLGGSSSINAMMYVRGMAADYDAWAAGGATGWDAAAMTETFRALEDDARGPAPHRGVGGPVRIEQQRSPRPVTQAFLDACEELGLPRVADYHVDLDGCGLTAVTQRAGRRWSAADAFLRQPMAEQGSALTVRTGVEVVRVVIEQGRAVGVEVIVDGRLRSARATREVVLSAGTIASPMLLQRSGIGPAEELSELGIEVVADRPAVGQNLQDHVTSGIIARTAGGSLHGADRDPRALLRWLRRHDGPLTSNLGEAVAFLRTRDGELPDIELFTIPSATKDHGRVRFPHHGLTIGAILLRPHSRGRVSLAADPMGPPRIDPGTFSDPEGEDLARLVDGVAFAQRLVTDTTALGGVVERLVDPPALLPDREAIAAHIRATAQTLYHPVGTCRMGSDSDAVVDPELRVIGVDGLRVVDASVMPTLVRGHTHAPALAIGMRGAELIARAWRRGEPGGQHPDEPGGGHLGVGRVPSRDVADGM